MRALMLGLSLSVGFAAVAARQGDPRLHGRWIGTYQSQPLILDFYGDTMLVVNDSLALNYEARGGVLRAWGDSTLGGTYWFALDRMLFETGANEVVTMARQDVLARPLFGEWRGTWTGDQIIQLHLARGGVASYQIPGQSGRTGGEWDRSSRTITFTWLPDSIIWQAMYDPGSNALLFQNVPERGTLFLYRAYRW
jgi:hypothetical protein